MLTSGADEPTVVSVENMASWGVFLLLSDVSMHPSRSLKEFDTRGDMSGKY